MRSSGKREPSELMSLCNRLVDEFEKQRRPAAMSSCEYVSGRMMYHDYCSCFGTKHVQRERAHSFPTFLYSESCY